jgi:hypothetical protein
LFHPEQGEKVKPTGQFANTASMPKTGLFALLGALLCIAGSAASAALPATAGAYATIEGPPKFSSAPGLPDGRIYEQVSPANKNGNEAGGSLSQQLVGAVNLYGFAAADGNAVLFEGTGPMGESPSGANKFFVANKKPGEPGWSTRALTPAEEPSVNSGLNWLDPSPDLSHAMVLSGQLLHRECGLALIGPDPFLAATYLGRTEIPGGEACGPYENVPAGGTPDFSTVYFGSAGKLLTEDASRAGGWGFYEYKEGRLYEAGTLPDGKVSEFGAVPAASGHGRAIAGNQVSAEGQRAFFVSPDPGAVGSCVTAEEGKGESVAQAAAACAPQLYVRENGERTLLVSRDLLTGEAPAPAGVLQMPNLAYQNQGGGDNGSDVFASPDGSQAFFQSASALTKPAEESSPGSEPKTYDFDVDTGALTYLPGVVLGEILATDNDGSSFAFLRPEAGEEEPAQLDLWSSGSGGGVVTPITQLPGPPADGGGVNGLTPTVYVAEAQMSSDGSTLAFTTPSRLSSAFNSGGAAEIYRYDVAANTLGCVSCAPAGVTPRGDASISALRANETYQPAETYAGTVDERGISADGDRIFFDSPDPLVPQDSNTNSPLGHCATSTNGFCPQGRDVYEWENGVVYLISTGKSPYNSYLVDSSENGNDVFFATAEGLVPGDTDAGYDVYDARIPHEGEPYPPAAVPCEGAVCQGPPNVPAPLTPPTSATFAGLGNHTPEVIPPPAKKVTTKTVKCKRGYVKKNKKCVKSKPKKKTSTAKKASANRRASR